MEFFQLYNEYDWVVKVLLSSKTDTHVNYSVNLFKNFMNKRRFDITEDLKITFHKNFTKIYLEHKKKLLSL